MFIAAPKDFVEKPTVKQNVKAGDVVQYWEEYKKKVAIANQILRKVSDYANVYYTSKPTPLPRNYDPFVCSICDYGVIIHSMWGAEAKDAIFKRYKQLQDTIMADAPDYLINKLTGK